MPYQDIVEPLFEQIKFIRRTSAAQHVLHRTDNDLEFVAVSFCEMVFSRLADDPAENWENDGRCDAEQQRQAPDEGKRTAHSPAQISLEALSM